MGLWSAYFFAKMLLYAGGHLDFSPWLNLAFATFTALPPQNARQRFAKNLVALPLGIMLLYHDSWLPPFDRVLAQAGTVAEFSLPYLLELSGRLFDWKVLLQLAALGAVYALARRKLRLASFVFLGILAIGLKPGSDPLTAADARDQAGPPRDAAPVVTAMAARNMRPEALDAALQQFHAREASREVRLQTPAADAVPFDILLLHVCSLSWDDLQAAGLDEAAVLRRFDILLTAFGTAASYSGPAAIRLLRGRCGQPPHETLYEAAEPRCLLIDGLQQIGFTPQWLMNHDGRFGDFLTDVRERGGMPATAQTDTGAAIGQRAFDGKPIYDDYSVLSRWWTRRHALPDARVVLYYNSISLHDGNRLEGDAGGDARTGYRRRAGRLLEGIGRFLDDLQRSGARAVVVLVPEHGAALRGDRRQIPGLREIPTPAITQVPLGVALVNVERSQPVAPLEVDTPSSYLALSELLSRLVADDPYGRTHSSFASYAQDLPQTEAVAENDGTVTMRLGAQTMLRTPAGDWSPWDAQPLD